MVEVSPPHSVTTRIALPTLARSGLLLVLALLSYYTLFRLPFLFAPRQRLMSASYAFGFNNSVAILAMAGLLGVVTLFDLFGRRQAIELPIEFASQRAAGTTRSIRFAFAIVALCYALLTCAMCIYNARAAPPLMWETRHLLHRTLLMDLYGLHPYPEVSAEYRTDSNVPPSVTYRALRPLGASHEQAYFMSHLLLNLAGLWCVYYVPLVPRCQSAHGWWRSLC